MSNFIRLIRFPNLVIIALTMCLLQYGVLVATIKNVVLSHTTFLLVILYTIFIAAAGNIINDIRDIEIDKMNKKVEKQLVGRIYTEGVAWQLYFMFNILSLIIALYAAFYNQNKILIYTYPFVVGLLYLYSTYFKKLPLIGNIIIALLCAYVPVLLFGLQTNHDFRGAIIDDNIKIIFIGYTVFAFLSTLFREIIKDIEDIEGDRQNCCRTLPIVVGIKGSKIVVFIVGFTLLLSAVFFSVILMVHPENIGREGADKIILLNLFISIPIIYALYKLIMAEEKKDFTYLSKLSKWIMLGGIIFIIIMAIK